jgi:hypothetical protein
VKHRCKSMQPAFPQLGNPAPALADHPAIESPHMCSMAYLKAAAIQVF